jgi:hypothetical protein
MTVTSTASPDRQDAPFVSCRVHILPSALSIGYTVHFYPRYGEPDGWYPEAYGHIYGVARMPESTGSEEQREWQSTVARRLRRQGVKLLSHGEADAYERSWGRFWALVWRTPALRRLVFN